MTLERAADFVTQFKDSAKMDLFEHFVSHFNLRDEKPLNMFASLCGFQATTNAMIDLREQD